MHPEDDANEALEAPPNKRKVYLRTFGCQMNEYDSQKLLKILESDFIPVKNPSEAELAIVNTCSVRDKPEQKLYSLLGELRELRELNPKLMVGVGGCVAQQEGENILKGGSGVDFVFGTHNLSLVPSLIQSRQNGLPPQVAVDYRDEWEELPLGLSGEGRVSSFVSISRGCNKNCTYCIVPTTRGPEVSRSMDEILREVRLLVHRGAREVVLLGQTVNSYGLDLTPRRRFVELLEEVSKEKELMRIRFTSPHPQEIKSDFIDLVTTNPKICRHVHMPLQSGSNRILKLMNRNYRRDKYIKIIDDLKSRVPDISITTDIIVGFPGETEEDFNQTMEILEYVRFDSSYSFMFSPRPGTVAAEMEEELSYEEKLARLQHLQTRQDQITEERLNDWIGREVQVLLEGASAKDASCLFGRTSQNMTLNLINSDPGLRPGMLVKAIVRGRAKFTLKGEYIKEK